MPRALPTAVSHTSAEPLLSPLTSTFLRRGEKSRQSTVPSWPTSVRAARNLSQNAVKTNEQHQPDVRFTTSHTMMSESALLVANCWSSNEKVAPKVHFVCAVNSATGACSIMNELVHVHHSNQTQIEVSQSRTVRSLLVDASKSPLCEKATWLIGAEWAAASRVTIAPGSSLSSSASVL
jgi:hypothetical protein